MTGVVQNARVPGHKGKRRSGAGQDLAVSRAALNLSTPDSVTSHPDRAIPIFHEDDPPVSFFVVMLGLDPSIC